MAKAGSSSRWVYFFGNGKADGGGDQRDVLGGKGAGLAEMTRIGLPVPAGFTIATLACDSYNKSKGKWPAGLEKQVRAMLVKLERTCKKKLGDAKDPLLVSVRSGAARSMPGMMDTILNLGLNDKSVEGLAKVSSNRRFAMDGYRRFIMMYGSTAKGVDRLLFEDAFDEIKNTRTRTRMGCGDEQNIQDTDVDADEMAEVVERFKAIYQSQCQEPFPQKPFDQLKGAINAVFDSWMADKAITYRKVENITGLLGTAVNVCQMVFGNMGDDCGTGVCFTRDPSTGEQTFYGDVLINAQGEDVVAGIRTPMSLIELKSHLPKAYEQLEAVRVILELHYKDMQDLEFTVEQEKLYMLQCRVGKRSPQAAFKIAVDQATKGLMSSAAANKLVKKHYLPKRYLQAATKPIITREDAIRRIGAADIERLFFPVLDQTLSNEALQSCHLGSGIGAVPGAASGEVAFSAHRAEQRASEGAKVILVRKETSPEDVGGMHVAAGILTATGGKTSHAAVVARGWGKCCIVGCSELGVDYETKQMKLNGTVIHEGDAITLDGSSGDIYDGALSLQRPEAPKEYQTLMKWCDQCRTLKVRANADTPADAAKAVELGAEGIGLCRTEHMFFDPSEPMRLLAMREMIVADTEPARRHALDKLLPFQRKDFEGIFKAMAGLPVTVRLLDPPLHEFLPQHDNEEAQQALADELNEQVKDELEWTAPWKHDERNGLESKIVTLEDIRQRIDQLHESNPMLGHRGCRLCITYPEILEMQVRAIIEAAVNCRKNGIKVLPEIMIPLSIDDKELGILVDRTRRVADEIIKAHKSKLKYLVGTMVETPRAALLADRLADVSEFFSFGTNDLTQMTMGLSRDDAGRFLPDYVDEDKAGIFSDDPFQSLDVAGVGLLVTTACKLGREASPGMKLGVCGEHGGDPASIEFFHNVGLDYVSCSPFRVPVARMAAAQAVIAASQDKKQSATTKRRKSDKRQSPKAARIIKVASSKKTNKRTAASKTAKRATAKKTSRR